jgi:putative ABC transport system substrate-binding protein
MDATGKLRRRRFLAAAATFLAVFPALAQRRDQAVRVATLDDGHEGGRAQAWALFHKRMHELGYMQGAGYVIDSRWANGDLGKLNVLAAELVTLKPDVIVTGGTPTALAAKRATSSIPIVFVAVADPVKSGLVANLARPEGNLTGTTNVLTEVAAKWLGLIREIAPTAKSLAFLTDTANPASMLIFRQLQEEARPLGVVVMPLDGSSQESVKRAFGTIAQERVDGLIMSAAGRLRAQRQQIIEAAARLRIPAVYALREFAEAGGLLSYGADLDLLWRRAADLVHRILKGAKPSEIPVEQAAVFNLVVNLRTAKALGLKIPQSVVVRADKLIE